MRISDWSSDVCSSDLNERANHVRAGRDRFVSRRVHMDGRAGRMRLVAEAVFCGLAAAFSPLHQGFERLPGDGRQAADWWCGMIALPLDAADLDRLGKFLGMLGSDHKIGRAHV